MKRDIQYSKSDIYESCQVDHRYGPNVHILANPYLKSMLAILGKPETVQPKVNYFISQLYEYLLIEVVNSSFPREIVKIDTRMKQLNKNGVYRGDALKYDVKVICVALARAGIGPSNICFEKLNHLFDPTGIIQDHFCIGREVNDKGEVISAKITGAKLAGFQNKSIVLFPDPMGATGGSLVEVISHYKNQIKGKAKKYIAMHLVVTPEYIRRMKKEHPDVEIFTIRLDRGLSSQKVLSSIPGTYVKDEKGLNEVQYIVPGLGGVGEIMNNCYV